MTHAGIALALLATVVYNFGFVLEKRALANLPPIDAHRFMQLGRTLFTAPAWLAGFVLIIGGLALQVVVLSLEPLTVAQPLQAGGLVVTIVLSRLVLHERLGRAERAGIWVLIAAVVLLSLSSGHGTGPGTAAGGIAVTVAAAPACLAALAIYGVAHRGSRHGRPASGVSYSLCAGLMYGVAGLGLKALSATVFAVPRPAGGLLATAILSPYLYVVLACSAAGMCLFQTALQRSALSIVAPVSMIIGTGYLVVVGSWLFHERLPSSPVLLSMRLIGGICAVTVPVILTVAAEWTAAARRPVPGGGGVTAPPPSAERPSAMSLDPLLLNLLACPIDKQTLLYLDDDGILYNPRLHRLYHVRDDIPVMLADQGETVGEDRHRELLAIAAAGGARPTLEVPLHDALRPHLAETHPGRAPGLAADQARLAANGHAGRREKASSGEDAA